ncbi:XrtA system polysaccharide deacetylase [Amphiplicatus metriothermophilus]|uniref:Chitooligosaccharide deacetylase n=1 Tax=Amphiplicatus metriothermophilus TaxID=1519374 RepID=A0A239PU94_9PROT|nr:XrtA system polysaccharide deacetylase [Amphiplicatus metriothermophilus]MBB5519198.1 polysaccharide deacetylase family protein (PEP-CTERM system associated) [Amphiplicatus metriothermophilus]SNT73267.1 polysaccharide deacetylase family protein, PEP-CTERM locus subfamily [Amphiplicatus metriothermophilus]
MQNSLYTDHNPGAPARFALSVDVEDYFQVWAFSSVIDRARWEDFPLRVEASTRRALDLIEESRARATFFVLGWIAERAPGLVREIAARGHEIASHGWDHRKVFDQSPAQFREDVAKTKRLLEDLAGVAVAGYRAPGFSIDARAPWAYEALAAAGYLYSSSAHPVAHDHYGDPRGPREPFRPLTGRALVEAPVATAEIFGRRVSCAGGGWFRAMPYAASRALLRRAAASAGGPVVFYFHPWEIDPDQPRIAGASLKARLRHYLNLDRMEGRLRRLLADFQWVRIDDALGLAPSRAAA